jgi:hypothetical protein
VLERLEDRTLLSGGTPGSVSGTVFNDLNGDGFKQSGEPGLQGWKVDLVDSGNHVVGSASTDPSGNYAIQGVGPGTFTLKEEVPSGWVQTAPASPGTYTFTTSSGTNVTGDNFGDVLAGSTIGVTGVQYYASYSTAPGANNLAPSNGRGTLVSGSAQGVEQMSIIRYLAVTFSTSVFLDPRANYGLNLIKVNGPSGAAKGTHIQVHPFATSTSASGQYTEVFSFSGAGTEYGSLEDGNYELTFNAAAIQGGKQGGPSLNPASYDARFHRLFGDVNGDGRVDAVDLSALRGAYMARANMTNYLSYLDFRGNGVIDAVVYSEFLRRYRTRLNGDGSVSVI